MPSNPRQKASNAQASAQAPQTRPTRQRNPPNPKHVSFENEQGDAAVAAANTAADKARQKKEQEKAKIAQIKANAVAAKRALQEQQAAMKRHEKEEASRRKDEEIRVRRLEAEMEALRRDKDLELERLRAAAADREEERRQEAERRLRQTTDEALDEFNLEAEAPTPRSLARIKKLEDQKNGPYNYAVKAVLRVQNGSQVLTKWHNKIGGAHTKGSFDIHALNIELDTAMEANSVNEFVEIKGWVKSSHGRGTRQTFTMSSISIDQWEQRVESITTAEWQKFVNYIIDVEITCTARAGVGLRRSIHAVDGATQSPSHRRTRTDRLEEQHAVVRDRNEVLGEKTEELITRWTCHDALCGHKGVCWIDDTGEHHRLNAVMRERWASAWQDGQATKYAPPYSLIKKLMEQSSGGDNQSSHKGRKASAMDQMRDMLQKQMELNMMKSMQSMANENQQPQQSQQYYAHAPPAPPPPPVYSYPPSYPPHGGYTQQIQQPGVIATQSPSPTPTPRAQRAPEPQQVTPQQRSSPIGARSEEEDIMDSFWQWKKEGTNKALKKLQICQTQAKFDQECWDLEDMKAMADTSSEVYKIAISAGLPQGLIRGLKADLKEFKGLWRDTYQPARALNDLGQQGGGFE